MPLVELTIYLTDSRFIEASRPARLKVFDEAVRPTSTPVIIDALAVPEFLVEVEAWAAKAQSS
jgi:enamine deaminase RidA (YjgF/YER057c/UK114 family)